MTTPFLSSIDTMAERSETDTPTVLRWIRDGDCPPPILVGGLPRFDPPTLNAWLAAGCPKGDPLEASQFIMIRAARIVDLAHRTDAAGFDEFNTLVDENWAEIEAILHKEPKA